MHTRSLPGRLRMEIPNLKRNNLVAHRLYINLPDIKGIIEVNPNLATGRCLMIYDEKIINAKQVAKAALWAASTDTPCSVKSYPAGAGSRPQNHIMEPEDYKLRNQALRIMASGGVLTLFWGLPPFGPFMPRALPFPITLGALVATGYPNISSGLQHLRAKGRANYDLLLSLAGLASAFIGKGYLGLASLWLSAVTDFVQKITLRKISSGIRNHLIKQGERVHVVTNKGWQPVLPAQILPGDVVRFNTGDYIMVEGEVISGSAHVTPVNEQGPQGTSLTRTGEEVRWGYTVSSGQIDVLVSQLEDSTDVAKMVETLENALNMPGKTHQIASHYAERTLPFAGLATLIIFIITKDIRRSLSMLLASAPGASGLAAPAAMSAAIIEAARLGATVKTSEAVEELGTVDAVIFNAGPHSIPEKVISRLKAEGYQIKLMNVKEYLTEAERFEQAEHLIQHLHQSGLRVAWVSTKDDWSCARKMADVHIVMALDEGDRVQGGDILLYESDPRQVYKLLHLSRKAHHLVKQNVYFVSGANTAGNLLGALGLTNEMSGTILNMLTSVGVVANSVSKLN